MSKGKKFDNGKADLSLVPLSALEVEAQGFSFGAEKYGRWNYTKGLEASRLIAAAMRHIAAWNQGEDRDPESGVSHLGHARCNLAMLLECLRMGTLIDDRNRQVPEAELQILVGRINDMFPEGTPQKKPAENFWAIPNPLDYAK
jgi:hypothetical protein